MPSPVLPGAPGVCGRDAGLGLECVAAGCPESGGLPAHARWEPAEERRAPRSGANGRRSHIEELLGVFWFPAALFAGAEAVSLAVVRKSMLVALTAGAFDPGPRYARVVEVHIWASVLMWLLAAFQVLGESVRRSPKTAWVHRRVGQAYLGLYFAVVFPTSLWLTFRQLVGYLGPAVGAVLLDTAWCTAYFTYRGWRVIRERRTARAPVLHGRLMVCGIMMSMSILPQRFLQLYLTGQKWHSQAQDHQLNYSVSILVTSVLFVVYGHFFDGPRGLIWSYSIGAENMEEAFGSATAGPIELWAWRLRWIMYAALYWAIRFLFHLGTHEEQ